MSLTSSFATPLLLCVVLFSVTDAEECEVCVGFLGRLYNSLVLRHTELSPELVEEGLIRACAETTGKENRLCYYLGASNDAAAKVTDSHVLDWSRDALSKMRVLELKRVLASWGEECRACLEKSEFIDLIQEVAPKHSSAQHRTHSEEF
ncbi:cerebral dopamine neurotrophic factor isoform X2 [Puntigrus tetrazona]|uniref:cerebral dopamine neurotrophic factor isoform X2 n=1 Tax=Puntigrus tetrazona TaxID=1606681 RepID=UPI001C8AD4B2|nr:cerebral dopamine neurotrophic factor isoform X2 [Puntigrus tetrazona]